MLKWGDSVATGVSTFLRRRQVSAVEKVTRTVKGKRSGPGTCQESGVGPRA